MAGGAFPYSSQHEGPGPADLPGSQVEEREEKLQWGKCMYLLIVSPPMVFTCMKVLRPCDRCEGEGLSV
jgi:hypothetical protein